jgi:FkbM family methyltransferase
MDVVGGVIARLDEPAPIWADRLRWRRNRRKDPALRTVDALVSRGDVVLDIGAAQGHFSSRMLDLVGAGGVVHAFEPNPVHHRRLETLSRRRPLHLHPVGLSDHAGQATLHIPVVEGQAYVGWASLQARPGTENQTFTVRTTRLDDVLDPSARVSFIKCDVEGHEDAVLHGAQALLARDRPVILIELEQRHRREPVLDALEFFAALGYQGWAVFRAGIRPLGSFDLERDQLSFLQQPSRSDLMPGGYVHDFLFVASDTDVGSLLDPSALATRGAPVRSASISP